MTARLLTLAFVFASAGVARADEPGWTLLFDGKTLDGWKVNGGTARYRVEGGAIVGTTVEGSPNTFLCKGDFADFVLELEVKCDPRLNSGVQVRSHVYAKDDPDPQNSRRAGVVYGPQCEIARQEVGAAARFYDEGRRGRWLAEINPDARSAFKDDGWNRYRIAVQGNRYRSWINGVLASDFTDDVDKSGLIGLQVHGIARGEGPYEVRWRDVRIRELKPGEEVAGPSASASASAGPKVRRDVAYAGSDNKKQTLDVYSPATGQGHPVLVWIHGGGWQVGDKAEVDAKPRAFVDRGFVFVSTNYRLVPEATIGQMAGDVAKAIKWTRDHAAELGADPDKIIVAGHSAGAQLAALVCADDRYLKAEGISLATIKGCVPVDGDTYDVPTQMATVEDRRQKAYRQKFGDEAAQKELSPITHVAKDKEIPPFLILHVAGHPETTLQSNRLVDALKGAGVAASAYPGVGKTHGTINTDLGTPGDGPSGAMFAFIEGVLKK